MSLKNSPTPPTIWRHSVLCIPQVLTSHKVYLLISRDRDIERNEAIVKVKAVPRCVCLLVSTSTYLPHTLMKRRWLQPSVWLCPLEGRLIAETLASKLESCSKPQVNSSSTPQGSQEYIISFRVIPHRVHNTVTSIFYSYNKGVSKCEILTLWEKSHWSFKNLLLRWS